MSILRNETVCNLLIGPETNEQEGNQKSNESSRYGSNIDIGSEGEVRAEQAAAIFAAVDRPAEV